MNVMIVDDSKTNAFMMAKMLIESDHNVIIAEDGAQALELLAEHIIHLLLIDWVLPVMNGPELAQRIRAEFPEPYRYIIMVTAKSGHEYLVAGLQSGVDDYMEKPVNAAELEARMKIGQRILDLEAAHNRNLLIVERSKREWEATTNAVPQLICLVDYAGDVIHANKTVEDWGLTSLSELQNIRIYDLLGTVYPDFAQYIEKIWPVVKSRLLHKRDYECEGWDEITNHHFYVQFQPIIHDKKTSFEEASHSFAAINIQDITERKQLELEIQEANRKSEELLLNVLPATIAERLKQGEDVIADSFDNVTILFADLVGFTKMTASISPNELINLLNDIFSAFDELSQQHGLEKIKTMGDAYLVVGGLPTPQDDHAHAIADMALDLLDVMEQLNRESQYHLQIRVGIESGQVVAGIIGRTKFFYDLWGDAVNVASRMESNGVPGCIQVAQTTYDLLKDDYHFEERGEIEIRGKGKLTTYWLLGRR